MRSSLAALRERYLNFVRSLGGVIVCTDKSVGCEHDCAGHSVRLARFDCPQCGETRRYFFKNLLP